MNTNTKTEFFKNFRHMAEEQKEICRMSKSVEEILEQMWEDNQKWHKENDERVFRESLTLEQLYRLDH